MMNLRAGMFTDDFGNKWSFFPPPPTVVDDFRIGDRVRLIGHPYVGNIKTGEIVDRAAPYHRGDWEVEIDDYGGSLPFREDEMERLTAPDVRAGRYYKNRSGVVVGPMETDDIGLRAYVDGKVRLFAASGEHLFGDDSLDLVEDVAAPVLRIEAGKYYRTRDWRKVGPIVATSDSFLREFYPFTVGDGDQFDTMFDVAWTESGNFWTSGEESELDLIAEWTDEPVAVAIGKGCAAAEVDNLADEYGPVVKAKFKVGDRVVCPEVLEAGVGIIEVVKPEGGYTVNYRDTWYAHCHGDDDTLAAAAPSSPAIVARLDNGQPRPATSPFVHPDRASAEREAARLAKMNVGKEFAVYEFVSSAKEERRYEHEWQRLAVAGRKIDAIRVLRRVAGVSLVSAKEAVEYIEREAA